MKRRSFLFAATFVLFGLQGCSTMVGGGRINMPSGQGPFPAVIVLHTIGGLSKHEKAYANKLSGHGYVAIAVNWKGSETTVTDTYEQLTADPNIDPDRIGLVGFSKGGEVSLWFASRLGVMDSEHQIAGVVNYYQGGYINIWTKSVRHPPTLFLHGDQDVHVKPFEIIDYCKLQRESGAVCDYHIYEDVGHAFTHKSRYNGYDRTATADAWKRALTFLDIHVKREDQ